MARATLGVISIGDMGVGISKLLLACDYRVVTNARDRSQATQDRARQNNIELITTDTELCNVSDYILSIVPPKDAVATAQRIAIASSAPTFKTRPKPLYFLDLNATSPRTAREISSIFTSTSPHIHFIDGGIIGGPPSLKSENRTWQKPSIVVSGPHRIEDPHLSSTLNMKHVNDTIGSATGLKMCFASLSKGFTALAIQAYTTAHNLGVLSGLQEHLDEYSPGARAKAERGLVEMPPKAYRWIHEMEQIAETFEADGGFEEGESVFRGVARTYDLVTNETELGKEAVGKRERGKTAEDVAFLMSEGTGKRKVQED